MIPLNRGWFNRSCLLLFAFLLCAASFAQDRSFVISGNVYDKNFRTPLIGGMAYLYDESGNVVDSCTIDKGRVWSNEQQKFFPMSKWRFMVEHKPAKYSVEVTYPKYEPMILQIDLTDMGKRQEEYEVDDVFLSKSAVKLKDVVVTATKVKFYNKGDTLVYNADAFQLAEGSMLDALIDQLPGIEMKDGGRIYVNGKFVENLTLNGKDFFGGNHQLLLENLGAYTVKDIAVYDKLGERSKFLGRELPGDKQFTMDVRLKKEYMETWLLNAEGGMGTADRYMGRMFFARSTSRSQVGLFGNFNNLSDQGRPGQHTLWRQANKSGGKQRVQHAGLTYSVDGKAGRVKNSGDLTFARIFTDLQRNTTRMNLLPSGTTYDYSYSNSNTDVLTLAQSHMLIINNKYWQGMVSEKVNYQKNDNTQSGVSALFDEEQLNMNRQIIDDLYTSGSTEWKPSLVNYTVNEEIVKGHKLNAFGRATNSFKFKKNADTFRLVLEANYTDEKRDRFNLYNIRYRQNLASDVKLNDYYKSPNNSYYVMAKMEYGYSFKSVFAYLSYGFQHDEKNTDQYRYQLDRLAEQGVFGTVPEGFASVMDPLNSHTAHYNTNTNRFGLDVCKSWLAGRVSLHLNSG